MTRYFAGNSLAAFSRTSSTVTETTTSGRFDSAYVSKAIYFGTSDNSRYIETLDFSASPSSLWVRFDLWPNYATNYVFLRLLNGGTNVFQIIGASSSTAKCQYWNGSAWVDTGSAFSTGTQTNETFVARVDLGSGFEMFVGGTSVASGSGWTGTLPTTVTNAQMNQGGGAAVSQVMIADYDLRDSHLMASALDGNSAANTDGTGDHTDVGELGIDDSTAAKLTTTTNKRGQTMAAITVPSGYTIAGMVVSGRGRVSGTITDGKLGVRGSGGTNSSGSGLSYNGGYEPRQRIVETDPDTAAAFTQSGFNAAEIYEEAV